MNMKTEFDDPSGPPQAADPSSGTAAEDLRTRALKALRAGRFGLAEELLARGEVAVGELIENLRIYQAELEIQNEELRRSQRENAALLTRFTDFFTTLPIAELVVDRLGLIIESNPEAQRLFGLRDPRYRPQFFARLVEEVDRGQVIQAWSRLGSDRSLAMPELAFRTTKGEGFIGDLHIARLPDDPSAEERFVCAVLDRTEAVQQREALGAAHERLNASERNYREVFDATSEAIFVHDATDRRLLDVNRSMLTMYGFTDKAEALACAPSDFSADFPPFTSADAERFYDAAVSEGSQVFEWLARRKDHSLFWVEISLRSGCIGGQPRLLAAVRDISSLKRSEEALYRLAHYDALTGLPNRVLLRARVDQAVQRAHPRHAQLAVLFLDLDQFKHVNDTLGHPVGDRLLQQVAAALAGIIRPGDNIARLGGDEFVILLEDLDDRNAAAALALRLLALFKRPFLIDGQHLYITASLGISIYPCDGADMDALLRTADVAMYQAKAQGRNTFRFFEPSMSSGATERLHLETALRGALGRGELTLHYQPQVLLENEQLAGAEALLRWQHPELGAILPSRFIPIAEEIGIIGELGVWVIVQACRQLAAWDRDGFRVPRLAVNLSMQQIEGAGLVTQIRDILTDLAIVPQRLELEVTESILMHSAERSTETLAALREIGVAIAIDDFGSGYSSLGYLQRLPVDRLKIDRVFVEHLTEDLNHDAIARAVIVLGRSLGLAVLAEGVETQAQADFLMREGCHEAQGYLFGRSVPAPLFKEIWAERLAALAA